MNKLFFNVFRSKHLSDEEIFLRIEKILDERNRINDILTEINAVAHPKTFIELTKQLSELNKIYVFVEKLNALLLDLRELEEMQDEISPGKFDEELCLLHKEYTENVNDVTNQIYLFLLDKGYIDEEKEDKTDLDILRFIEYAGPEYAWRLGINIGIDVTEARERLERLMKKGLLEKVQGTMLEGYHREKDWIKHMNHTYYRLSREGKLFLRKIRRDTEM